MTPKQQRFCEEYLVDLNATQAALRAGYSRASAYAIGSENLKKPEVAAEIARLRDAQAERTAIKADRVLEELARIAFGSPAAFFHGDGRLKSITEMDESVVATIAQFEATSVKGDGDFPATITKVKSWDKLRALELLGKHLGMWRETSAEETVDVFTSFMRDVQAMRASVPVRH